jgi:hypothetical protein
MKPHCAVAYSRPLMNPHAAAERLAIWADQARRSDRIQCADGLLVLAWEAYDRPDRAHLSNDNCPAERQERDPLAGRVFLASCEGLAKS